MSADKIHEVEAAVHAVFDPIVGPGQITIKKRDGIYVGINRPKEQSKDQWCMYLELYISTENDIHVHHLDNCGDKKKGRDLLILVEELAMSIGSRQITLLDASKIKLQNSSFPTI